MGMVVGYARVSTGSQSYEDQVARWRRQAPCALQGEGIGRAL
jgi:DNA invertase Pin-like site-specific DNA recombinase